METASTTIVTSYLLHVNKVYTKKKSTSCPWQQPLTQTFPAGYWSYSSFSVIICPQLFLCSSTRLL